MLPVPGIRKLCDPFKVTVIIPTFNRYAYLLRAVESVRAQTYKGPVRVIVVDDGSTDALYYNISSRLTDNTDGPVTVEVIRLDPATQSSRAVVGYGCPAHARNAALSRIEDGDGFVAFLDDDDAWLPAKLQTQLDAMAHTEEMSCTDGLLGIGAYRPGKQGMVYNGGRIAFFQQLFRGKGSTLLDRGFPDVWTRDLLLVHNCCITSSVMMTAALVRKTGLMKTLKNGEDYDYWLRAMQHTDCRYVQSAPLFYYDNGHGDGRHYDL